MTGEQRGGTGSRLRRSIASSTLIALLATVGVDTAGVASGPHRYRNPVSRRFAAAFAQPSVVRADDGLWYAIGASGPLRLGEETTHLLPIARSSDLVSWSYVGDVFDPSTAPDWAASSDLSGPDVRFVDGRYALLYAADDTNVSQDDSDGAVGVAFAPTPAGPWRDSGAPLVPPRARPSGGYLAASDPSLFTTATGDRVLYYRSGPRSLSVVGLTGNVRSTRGRHAVIARGPLGGPFALRRGRHVVLLTTRGSCCAGPASGETILAGRAAGPRGPFVDRRGVSLMRGGGSVVVAANGNRWVSTGHGSQVTDLAGRDWLAFHAVPRPRPFLDPAGSERRSLLLDRLRWRDGWPLVRAGRWASQRPQRAPVTRWDVGETFGAETSAQDWVEHGGTWTFLDDRIRGSTKSCREAYLTSSETISGSRRVEADLRATEQRAEVGLVAAFGDRHRSAVAWIDSAFDEFLLSVEEGGALFVTRSPLPSGFRPDRFHRVVIELKSSRLTAELIDAGEAVAVLHALNLAGRDSKRSIGVAVACGSGEAANVGATRLRRDPAPSVRLPAKGKPVARLGDEFDGDELAPGWSWVRAPDGATARGVFRWRTQAADLGASDTASVLLRAAPRGTFTVETKLRMRPVERAGASSAHAGLIAYRNDDLHAMLTRAGSQARPIAFAKELVTQGFRERGAMPVAPSAEVTWLRLAHRVDPHNGEHEYRSASSPDGVHWDWGGTWTLPRGRDPRIGLVSLGGRGAVARFDYFRVLRP